MKSLLMIIFLFVSGIILGQEDSATTSPTVDIIWLKDGSKLKGTILQWDLERGMEFKLATGATVYINKADIDRVLQEEPAETRNERVRYFAEPKPYAFKEEGWYHNTSGFFNISNNGGAGIHHVMGWRFNRLLGIGIGTGIETHDFNWVRNIIPIYAEARGFLLPQKITPYYALKLGYGIALNNRTNGTINARGGIHISPELGVRFGGGDVSYYLGLEYKLQNASFTNEWWGGGVSTDRVSYRRVEMRTGLLF